MKLVLGLMSGTSLDGIDVALIRTDGETVAERLGFQSYGFDEAFRTRVQSVFGQSSGFGDLETEITNRHIQAVERFLQTEGVDRASIDLIGFHGQTVFHDPDQKNTIQLGDGCALAKAVGIDVVNDLRIDDVKAGGQGAPLVPVYHQALTAGMERPRAILNLGGVGNVTWIDEDRVIAFDTGPANALIDDYVRKHSDQPFDKDGDIAASGDIDDEAVNSFMTHPYFEKPFPKSLDRDEFAKFANELVDDLSFKDAVATLSAFTVASIMKAQDQFPYLAESWIVCGGGRLNKSLMSAFKAYLFGVVMTAEQAGWNGDAIEAEAFAFLAARSAKGLDITYPETTGVPKAMSGGRYHKARP